MAKFSRTFQEVRDFILRKVGYYNNSKYEAIVQEIINDAIIVITGEHDWEGMRRKTTLTYSASAFCDACIELPADVDRVLVIRPTDESYEPLIKLEPERFEQLKKFGTDILGATAYYCINDWNRAANDAIPNQVIEVLDEPTDGATFYLWYIIHLDEQLTADLGKVFEIPTNLVHLIQQYALVETMHHLDLSNTRIQYEKAKYEHLLKRQKEREKYGQDRQDEITQRQSVVTWNSLKRAKL